MSDEKVYINVSCNCRSMFAPLSDKRQPINVSLYNFLSRVFKVDIQSKTCFRRSKRAIDLLL